MSQSVIALFESTSTKKTEKRKTMIMNEKKLIAVFDSKIFLPLVMEVTFLRQIMYTNS